MYPASFIHYVRGMLLCIIFLFTITKWMVRFYKKKYGSIYYILFNNHGNLLTATNGRLIFVSPTTKTLNSNAHFEIKKMPLEDE